MCLCATCLKYYTYVETVLSMKNESSTDGFWRQKGAFRAHARNVLANVSRVAAVGADFGTCPYRHATGMYPCVRERLVEQRAFRLGMQALWQIAMTNGGAASMTRSDLF